MISKPNQNETTERVFCDPMVGGRCDLPKWSEGVCVVSSKYVRGGVYEYVVDASRCPVATVPEQTIRYFVD